MASPIGAALFGLDGRLLGRGHNGRVQDDDPAMHAETAAFRAAGRQRDYRDTIMVTTLSPCWYCSGLVRQFGIGTGEIDYPVPWASDAGTSFVAERDTYRRLLKQAGFRVEHERDCRVFGIESFARLRASWSQGPPPLGPHLVIGQDFATKVANLVAAMQRGFLAPTEMISTATGA